MDKYYVTMTDNFMSGWGESENKINKLVIECENYNDALIVKENASYRGDMKYINISNRKPSYNKDRYYTSFVSLESGDYNNWHIKDYFKNKKMA